MIVKSRVPKALVGKDPASESVVRLLPQGAFKAEFCNGRRDPCTGAA